ncbi:MAG: DUF5640 domain-containing protein [Acutalibacteraceae bacterium]
MSKSTKIMLAVIGSVVAVCVIITAAVSIGKSRNNNLSDPTGTTAAASQNTVGETVASSETTTAPAQTLESQIIGKWADSAGMSGYEFFSDGSANVTYVNLTVPVINMPINGTAKGSYTVNGSTLTVEFSIYKKTITDTFTASVENNTLTLINRDDGEKSTYQRQSDGQETSAQSGITLPSNKNEGIYGAWTDSSQKLKYLFREDGTAKITVNSIEYDGVYLIDGDQITIQFNADNGRITEEYRYTVSGNSMSFKDDSGKTILFVRDNGQSSSDLGLVGKWMDSSDMSGYTFKADGTVEITYVNFTVPVVNMPINGNFSGTYSVDGDIITIRSSIYSRTVINEYTYVVDGNNLTLTSVEDGKVHSYSRSAS